MTNVYFVKTGYYDHAFQGIYCIIIINYYCDFSLRIFSELCDPLVPFFTLGENEGFET